MSLHKFSGNHQVMGAVPHYSSLTHLWAGEVEKMVQAIHFSTSITATWGKSEADVIDSC